MSFRLFSSFVVSTSNATSANRCDDCDLIRYTWSIHLVCLERVTPPRRSVFRIGIPTTDCPRAVELPSDHAAHRRQVERTTVAESEAYRANLHAGRQVTYLFVSNMVHSAADVLETTEGLDIASDDSTTAQMRSNSGRITNVRDGTLGQNRCLRSSGSDQYCAVQEPSVSS